MQVNDLEAVLSRRPAEPRERERPPEADAAEKREEAERPAAVQFAGALSHLNGAAYASPVDPAAVKDKARAEDEPRHLVDIIV